MASTSQMESSKLKVKCTYEYCEKHFENEKQMKRHKKDDPEHFFCKRCDKDCEDWDDLTKHKVAKMAPWLDTRITHGNDESPDHIVCEFCGADFKSFGGRKTHRELYHQADQTIYCPGCPCIFARASQLLSHFEENECEEISHSLYVSNVTFKHVTGQIWNAPNEYAEGCNVNSDFASSSPFPAQIESDCDTDTEDGEDGGITLLDVEDAAQRTGHSPLQPNIELTAPKGRRVDLTRENLESWPRLPGQVHSQISHDLNRISISSATPSTLSMSASDYAKSIIGGTASRSYREAYPRLGSASSCASIEGCDDGASDTTVNAKDTIQYTTTLAKGNVTRALFKDAKPTPKDATYWGGCLGRRQVEALDNSSNLLYKRFWDPSHKDYNAKRFLHDLIGKYCCPFGGCDAIYDDSSDLSEHFREAHMTKSFRCPHCSKIFKKGSSLMAHAEAAGGKCEVKDTTGFDQLLDTISGGFLEAKQIRQPRIVQVENALVKADDVVNGVMSLRYEAKKPKSHQGWCGIP